MFRTVLALAFSSTALWAVHAQSEGDVGFTPDQAILDTSVPFAIGAREGRQALRGAFGWPTYQEGVVEGVYFRFDPDGYARFSSSPRLDQDVFEVLCRQGTRICAARKGSLSLSLDGRGRVQVLMDGLREGDRFALDDGVESLPLADRLRHPLDRRLELLLGTGGDLVVFRGADRIVTVSLVGFQAIAAYLRWVAAGQDSGVLPANWPVPTGDIPLVDTPGVGWSAPAARTVPGPQGPDTQPAIAAPPQSQTAALEAELATLRAALRQEGGGAQTVVSDPLAPVPIADVPVMAHPVPDAHSLTDIAHMLQDISARLERIEIWTARIDSRLMAAHTQGPVRVQAEDAHADKPHTMGAEAEGHPDLDQLSKTLGLPTEMLEVLQGLAKSDAPAEVTPTPSAATPTELGEVLNLLLAREVSAASAQPAAAANAPTAAPTAVAAREFEPLDRYLDQLLSE